MITTRPQRVLAVGAFICAGFASLGWLAARGTIPPESQPLAVQEEQRLHDMALSNLRETQEEVAKMKAHGIGVRPAARR